jgi:hypothetical protein
MKKLLLAACLLAATVTAKAINLSLYIGAAQNADKVHPKYDLQLVICNNQPDTVFIKRDDLDMIYPNLTNDPSELSSGTAFYFCNNAPRVITDVQQLKKLTRSEHWSNRYYDAYMNRKLAKENDKLPQVNVVGNMYYAIAPGKCITLNSLAQSLTSQLIKLKEIDKENDGGMQVNLSVPIRYFTSQDKHISHMLLIARQSDELKACLLKTKDTLFNP